METYLRCSETLDSCLQRLEVCPGRVYGAFTPEYWVGHWERDDKATPQVLAALAEAGDVVYWGDSIDIAIFRGALPTVDISSVTESGVTFINQRIVWKLNGSLCFSKTREWRPCVMRTIPPTEDVSHDSHISRHQGQGTGADLFVMPYYIATGSHVGDRTLAAPWETGPEGDLRVRCCNIESIEGELLGVALGFDVWVSRANRKHIEIQDVCGIIVVDRRWLFDTSIFENNDCVGGGTYHKTGLP